MRDVAIIGVGCTPFGAHEGRSLQDLAVQACLEAMADAGVRRDQVESFYLGNFAAGMLAGQELAASMVANGLGLREIPVTKVEGACASAGIALRHGYLMVASGLQDIVLVAGVEKMTSATTEEVTAALSAAADRQGPDGHAGLTFPGFFALVATRHAHEYGTTPDHLAAVALKNRSFALRNPLAQFRKPVTLEQIRDSRLIADPLRLFDCCPVSDGAAAAVLCPLERVGEFSGRPVRILASAQCMGETNLSEIPSLTSLRATSTAAQQAYQQAGLGPEDVDVAEVHDCFTIAEVVAVEDLGFFPKGEGGPAAAAGLTGPGGRVVVNPSGGLLSKGHPVGATGLAQIYEIVHQLRGDAVNQVPDARIGLAHNLGGTGGVATVHILGRL